MPNEPMTLAAAADHLGVHYMTVYRYVRTGLLPATKCGGSWLISPADLATVQRGRVTPRPRPRAQGTKATQGRLLSRLVAGDEAGAWGLLEAALGSDTKPDGILLDLIGPTLRAVGSQWEKGDLSIAEEHRASAVAARLISRLGGRFVRRGVKLGTVVLASPAGELHSAPVAITANLLRWRGFDVVELGADTPADALADAVARESDVLALGLACTTSGSERAAHTAITTVRRVSPEIVVILGGGTISGLAEAQQIGADLYTGHRGDGVVLALEGLLA
jgi:excisionase family DNA binding protein